METAPASVSRSPVTALLLAVLAGGFVFYFWSGIVSLLQAWDKPEYSHGYIIPVIALALMLKLLPAEPFRPTPVAAGLLMLGGLLIGMFGNMAAVADIVTYGLLFSLAGIIVALAGWQGARRAWPAWLYLWFMLPLPNFIYWPLSIKLQFISSEIGVYLIRLMNVPVYLEGNIIDLGVYQLQVAEACSGLRYLFPLASFSFLFAVLYKGPKIHKAIIFLAAIPITVLMNSVRIAVIGILVNQYGREQAEGFLHFFEGWVIFLVCIILLLLLTLILQRFRSKRASLPASLDLDFSPARQYLLAGWKLWDGRSLVTVSVLLAVMLGASAYLGRLERVYPHRDRFADFPMTIADWSGRSSYLDYDLERVLAADDYILADYTMAIDAEPVNLLVVYYRSQNEGSGIHSPEVCIPAGGWEVSRWAQATINAGNGEGRTFAVNRAIIQKGEYRQLVYYWFQQRGMKYTNDYSFKLYSILGTVSTGRSDGALVRVVTPIGPDGLPQAEKRLANFLKDTLDELPRFVPP